MVHFNQLLLIMVPMVTVLPLVLVFFVQQLPLFHRLIYFLFYLQFVLANIHRLVSRLQWIWAITQWGSRQRLLVSFKVALLAKHHIIFIYLQYLAIFLTKLEYILGSQAF